MAEWSYPWGDNNGDRVYSEYDHMQYFALIYKDGIIADVNFGTAMQVKQTPTASLQITAGAGAGFIAGNAYLNSVDKTFTIPTPSTVQARTDSIVLRRDDSAKMTSIEYKQNSTQVVNTDTVKELQLAIINVPANATSITQSNITDMRANTDVCGFSTPYGDLAIGDMLTQAENQINDVLNQLKDSLNGNAVANLQGQINTINTKLAVVHLTGTENVNTLGPGLYYADIDTVATKLAALGAPTSKAFELIVTSNGLQGFTQKVTELVSSDEYIRSTNTATIL